MPALAIVLVKSPLYIVVACAIACSGAPRDSQLPDPQPRVPVPDAGRSDALATLEPDAADEPLVCETYDEKNPACRGSWLACTEGHARCKCSDPPNVDNPACWAVMPCPRVPDRRVRACRPAFPDCADVDHSDALNLHCPPAAVTARVIRAEAQNGKTFVTIAVGSGSVSKHWKATLLRADSDEPLPGGELTIVRMTPKATIAEVSVTVQTVRDNPRVRLVPP